MTAKLMYAWPMFHLPDLPDRIPLFPLPGALLLPRWRLPLRIFEPRYLAMLDDVLKTPHRLIGMIQPRMEPGGKESRELHRVGCAGRVVTFGETPNRRYQIELKGICRFRLIAVQEGFKPNLTAEVDWAEFAGDLEPPEPDPGFQRTVFLKNLLLYFEQMGLKSDWSGLNEADEVTLVNSLAMTLPLDVEDKQALLESPGLTERRQMLEALMAFAVAAHGDRGALQ